MGGKVSPHVSVFLLFLIGLAHVGCRCSDEKNPAPPQTSSSSRPSATQGGHASEQEARSLRTALRGGALAHAHGALYVADEDHNQLHVIRLPLTGKSPPQSVQLPGPPAQVVGWEKHLAVTVRQPSQLLVYTVEGNELTQKHSIELPDDAWGLAVTPDRKTAWVTSPWVAQVSLVDLERGRVRLTSKVKREPRGIALAGNGRLAFVSHLTSGNVTQLTDTGKSLEESVIEVPAAPLRSPTGVKLPATLTYAPMLSPDGEKLFLPRHAVGALGKNAWFGAMTVDVMLTETGEGLAPVSSWGNSEKRSKLAETLNSGGDTSFVGQTLSPVTQPRAALYRKKTNTLIVAGEGDDRLAFFSANALDPTLSVKRIVELGEDRHKIFGTAGEGGAPTGLALSEDEDTLWVYCRTTDDLIQLNLNSPDADRRRVVLANPPSDANANTGRSLFYNATDRVMSGGLACAGCHPEGRDDGQVWHETTFLSTDGKRTNFVGHSANIPKTAHTKGVPRRTPMLAGRLRTQGPFGWHGESESLPDREVAGFALHRWGAMIEDAPATTRSRALFLSLFLRNQLRPPMAQREKALSEKQARGEEIFLSKEAQCSSCHVPDTGYTNQEPFPLPPLPTRPGFDKEKNQAFKTPSLRSLFGRAPYFHDGSSPTLFHLIETNHDRMGKTSHLGRDDRDALIAFLETL